MTRLMGTILRVTIERLMSRACISWGHGVNQRPTWRVDEVHEVGLARSALHDQAHGHHLEADAALLLVQARVREAHRLLAVAHLRVDVVRLLHKHVHHLRSYSAFTCVWSACRIGFTRVLQQHRQDRACLQPSAPWRALPGSSEVGHQLSTLKGMLGKQTSQ